MSEYVEIKVGGTAKDFELRIIKKNLNTETQREKVEEDNARLWEENRNLVAQLMQLRSEKRDAQRRTAPRRATVRPVPPP